LKQNNDKSYKNYSHEFPLHLCIQYSRPIALSKVLLQFRCCLMYTAMVTDTDHRFTSTTFTLHYEVPQSQSSQKTPSTLNTLYAQWLTTTCCLSLQLSTCHYMHISNTLLSSNQSHSITLWKHLSVCFSLRGGAGIE
jgi:hypothetical protein